MPGPNGNFITDLQYLRGFLQMQDLVDKAILAYTKETLDSSFDVDNFGVYTQQQPYPCFEIDM